MIVVYPMLTSSDISSSVLPGICKVLEKFILIYSMEEVFKILRAFGVVGQVVKHTKSYSVVVKEAGPIVSPSDYFKGNKDSKNSGKNKEDFKVPSIRVQEPPKMTDLSLEPTWLQIDTQLGSTIIGIKVIPFPVKSNVPLAQLLLNDSKLKGMQLKTSMYQRKLTRVFKRLRKKIPLVGGKGGPLTGDPMKDIVFASTKYAKNIFSLLNYMDISRSEELYNDPHVVAKLQSLSWGHYVIADDAGKKAMFCMKQFGGLCSTVNYAHLFATLGKEQLKVYEDLEKVRASAGPFMSRKIDQRKMFGESFADNKLREFMRIANPDVADWEIDETLQENEDILTEDVMSSIKKYTTGTNALKMFKNVEKSIKTKDSKKIKNALKGLPKIPLNNLKKFCERSDPDFKKNLEMSKKVLQNSLNVDKKLIEPIAYMSTFAASYKNKDPKKSLKPVLTSVVKNMRSVSYDKDKAETIAAGILAVPVGIWLAAQGIFAFIIASPLFTGIAIAVIVIVLLLFIAQFIEES